MGWSLRLTLGSNGTAPPEASLCQGGPGPGKKAQRRADEGAALTRLTSASPQDTDNPEGAGSCERRYKAAG